MADELDIAYSTIQSYENEGDNKIQLETLEKIAKFYQLSLLELLSYENGESGSFIYEPKSPLYGKKGNGLKVIIELDGLDETLNAWFGKLKKINATL